MTGPITKEETAAMFKKLRELKRACGRGANMNDVAVVLITACIEEGLNVRARIIPALEHLGLEWNHVARTLRVETGDDPRLSRWSRRADGTYVLHGDDPGTTPSADSAPVGTSAGLGKASPTVASTPGLFEF